MADVIGSMPSAIVGGVSFILYGMISAIGVRNIVENQVDFTKSRNLIIAAVILVCGLGFSDGLTFVVAGTSITLTGLAIAALAGILLNAILPGKDYDFGANPHRRPEPRHPPVNNPTEQKRPGRRCGRGVLSYLIFYYSRTLSCQKATALAAATFRESTPWDMGMRTV